MIHILVTWFIECKTSIIASQFTWQTDQHFTCFLKQTKNQYHDNKEIPKTKNKTLDIYAKRFQVICLPSGGCTSKKKVRFIYQEPILPKWLESSKKKEFVNFYLKIIVSLEYTYVSSQQTWSGSSILWIRVINAQRKMIPNRIHQLMFRLRSSSSSLLIFFLNKTLDADDMLIQNDENDAKMMKNKVSYW